MSLISFEEESLLLTALKRGYHRSEFWREKLSSIGISDSDLIPGFPYSSLPLISKKDILQDQASRPPFGKLLAVEPEKIRRLHKTSGTTTTPFFIALTQRDILDTYTSAERAFANAGVGPGDRIVHCLNFNMWSGGVSDYLPLENVGATGIPFGVGNTSLLLEIIQKLEVNAISATPSYMFTLRDRCQNDLGIDPKSLGLKKGYFGGEGLLQMPGVRETIESTFGLTAYDANYGMSEITSIIAGEGKKRDGLDYHCYGMLYVELIDQNDNIIPIEDGARGELVFSTLRREAQPLFRYRTNDIAEIVSTYIGDDGLRRLKLRDIGRSDDMLVIRGVNFYPQSLLSIINEFKPEISHNYHVVRPNGNDEAIDVVLETTVCDLAEQEALAKKFIARVSAFLQVKVRVHWYPLNTINIEGNKSKYLINNLEQLF